jgi:hypothetical protein
VFAHGTIVPEQHPSIMTWQQKQPDDCHVMQSNLGRASGVISCLVYILQQLDSKTTELGSYLAVGAGLGRQSLPHVMASTVPRRLAISDPHIPSTTSDGWRTDFLIASLSHGSTDIKLYNYDERVS